MALLWILSATTWAERLPTRLYTTEDGLWSGFINFMMRDSRGFMWFCTRDGLSRFDGYHFTNYKIAGGPASQNFTHIFETRAGVFWVVLSDNRLYRFDPAAATSTAAAQADQPNGDGRPLLRAELISSTSVTAIITMVEGHNGNLWVVGNGLFLLEESTGHTSLREVDLNLPQEWKPSFLVSAMTEGDDGSLWLATSYGLLRRLPDGRVVQYHLSTNPGAEGVRTVLADSSGYVWAAFAGGAFVLKPEPLSELAGRGAFSSLRLVARPQADGNPLPQVSGMAIDLASLEAFRGQAKHVMNIYQQSNRRIWLVTKDRLVVFDGRQFHWFEDARLTFSGLVEDLDGDLWISSNQAGVMRFSPRGLKTYGTADGLGNQDVASIHEDDEGRVYAVSPGWLISRFEGGKFSSIHANIPDSAGLWSSPLGFLDHTGQWWFLTSRGLYRFPRTRRLEDLAKEKPRLYTKLDGMPGERVYCMFEDSRGDLWISTRDYPTGDSSGLVRWRRSDERFHKLTEADGLPRSKSAASFAEDRAGNLWFGFYEGGLARYTAGRFTEFTPADGLPEGFITALHLDHLGRLWLTSSAGGLARIDDTNATHPRFVRFTTRDGLSSDNSRSLTEDLGGDLYVGTVRGLDRLTPESGKIKHYGLADGLAGDFVSSAYRDRKGGLWFGTFIGVSRLDPQPEPTPAAPLIRIEGLRIAGVKQPLSEFGTSALAGLELRSAQNNLQIDFSSLSMARAALLRYQYKLQGVDRDWSSATDQRTVHYANLAPGTYRFLVRAIDPSGISSVQPASVDFQILPPLWKRWWFMVLVATALACSGTLLYRYRVSHLLELERIRTHIATDLHDDIGASLSQIAVLSEVARRQVDGSAAVSQPLSTIASTARELVDSMSDIVWAVNPNRDNLGDLAQRMRRFASDLFAANDIEFHFDTSETERATRVDADMRRQVFLIFKESSHNIVRHSECCNVEIDLHIDKHAITLTIKDDGKGFDLANAGDGHGLMSMNRRAKRLGGALEIHSRAAGGTVVSLRVPLGRRAASA